MSMTTITIRGEDLNNATQWVSRLCPTKPDAPVLQGIVLDADEELVLSAYDWEVAGSVTGAAVVLEPGKVLIPGRWLAAVAKVVAHEREVDLTATDKGVMIRAGRSTWKLPVIPMDDYPRLPAEGDPVATLDGPELRTALERILPAADRSGSAPFNSAVSVVGDETGLWIAATDRYRIAVAQIAWNPVTFDTKFDAVVPVEFLEAATGAIRGAESAPVELRAHEGGITLATATHRLTGRLVGEPWPEWQKLVPTRFASEAVFVVGELQAALDRVLAIGEEKEPIRLDVDADGFELTATGSDRGATAYAAVSEYDGKPAASGLNPRYLQDALGTLRSDLAVARFGSRMTAPVDLVPFDSETRRPMTDFRHMVVPVHPKMVAKAKG